MNKLAIVAAALLVIMLLALPLQVVGVARDAKYRYISSSNEPFIYVPNSQQPQSAMEFYIRHAPGRQIAADIRTAMAQVESNVPIVMLQSFEDAAAIASAQKAKLELRRIGRLAEIFGVSSAWHELRRGG